MNARQKRVVWLLLLVCFVLSGLYFLSFYYNSGNFGKNKGEKDTGRALTSEETNAVLKTLAPPPRATSSEVNPPLSKKEQTLIKPLAPPPNKTPEVPSGNPYARPSIPPPSTTTLNLLNSLAPPQHN